MGNFYASTLVRLRPADPPAPSLALVAGVAVEEGVKTHLSGGRAALDPGSRFVSRSEERRAIPAQGRGKEVLQLKWPNDLLLDRAKLAGILLERAEDAVVVGIGVNLAQHPQLPDRLATSLAAHGVDVAPEVLLETVAESFARWLSRWRGEGLAAIRAAWLERAHPVGSALSARLPDGGAVAGLFGGLDADGALILLLAGGERRVIHAGDVFLL